MNERHAAQSQPYRNVTCNMRCVTWNASHPIERVTCFVIHRSTGGFRISLKYLANVHVKRILLQMFKLCYLQFIFTITLFALKLFIEFIKNKKTTKLLYVEYCNWNLSYLSFVKKPDLYTFAIRKRCELMWFGFNWYCRSTTEIWIFW